VARHVIDLSQPLSRESQLHPFFPPTQILRHIQHTDADEGRPSFAAEIIITSNHAATHVDAFGHYDRTPGAAAIAEMPLEVFCGEAVCVDVRQYPKAHDVTAGEQEQALKVYRDYAYRLRDEWDLEVDGGGGHPAVRLMVLVL
jgi:kynurenine formamidase